MTRQRDLKRRVRERQARTGESYTAALLHVRGEPEPPDSEPTIPPSEPIDVIEMVDITELGATLGLRCQVRLASELADRVDVTGALRQLCSTLLATPHDPQLATMRDVVLRGQPPLVPAVRSYQDEIQFARRVRAGIGGVTESGHMMAFAVTGRLRAELVVFVLWITSTPYRVMPPTLVVASADLFFDHSDDVRMGDLAALRRIP